MPADADLAIEEPLPDGFRREVGWLRRLEKRRVFPARIQLGRPGTPDSLASDPLGPLHGQPWPLPGWADDGTWRDACERMVASWVGQHGDRSPTWWWLTRPGQPRVHDEDPAWQAAARWATAAHGLTSHGFVVVTRYGWYDAVTGETRRWKRLRLKR